MKVLMFDNSVTGGIATYTDTLVEGLRAAGAEVALAAPSGRAQGAPELPPVIWGDFVPNRGLLYASRVGEAVRSAAALARGVATLSPDVVHLQTELIPRVDPWAQRIVRTRVPVVITAHDPVSLDVRGPGRLERQARRWRGADAVIIHGDEPKALVEERAGRAQVFVVPVDLPLGGAPIDRREARRHLGLPDGPTVLLLGLLRPYKGLGLLADAWPDVVARCPKARLVLAGAAPVPLAELERLRRMPGVEVREGYLPEEAIDLWAAAPDALVLPYLHGTHSGVLHRGLAMGTPALASPPLAEEVQRTGAGRVVPLDAGAWTEAILDALGRDPLPPSRPPSSRATVDGTLAVYRSVLARRAGRD